MTLPPARSSPIAGYRHRLANETFAGMVLLAGGVLALVWANTPWRATYETLADFTIGPEALGMHLPLSTWASDGLLVIFFFVVGLELKSEFVTGALRDVRQAGVPIIAAVFGMAGPAAVYLIVQAVTGSGDWGGWAIPVATDIAFATALLGIFGRGFPPALRTFLLTLAVVDDLLGITIIATVFTEHLNLLLLGASLVVIAIFAVLVQRGHTPPWLLIPLGILAWALMHSSGVHATIAGVLLGMVVPAKRRPAESRPLTEAFEIHVGWLSAGFVLPVFAFFAAGVNVVDSGGLGGVLTDPVAVGVSLGLPVGKLIGIWGGTALLIALTPMRLGNRLQLGDVAGVSLLAGVGFTVSLLIAQLSFDPGSHAEEHARIGVIIGSFLASILGGVMLRIRAGRRYEE